MMKETEQQLRSSSETGKSIIDAIADFYAHPTHTQLPSDRRLGQASGSQQPRPFTSVLFQLLVCEHSWLPGHGHSVNQFSFLSIKHEIIRND